MTWLLSQFLKSFFDEELVMLVECLTCIQRQLSVWTPAEYSIPTVDQKVSEIDSGRPGKSVFQSLDACCITPRIHQY